MVAGLLGGLDVGGLDAAHPGDGVLHAHVLHDARNHHAGAAAAAGAVDEAVLALGQAEGEVLDVGDDHGVVGEGEVDDGAVDDLQVEGAVEGLEVGAGVLLVLLGLGEDEDGVELVGGDLVGEALGRRRVRVDLAGHAGGEEPAGEDLFEAFKGQIVEQDRVGSVQFEPAQGKLKR